MRPSTELTTRADQGTLPAGKSWTLVLSAEAAAAAPRIVTIQTSTSCEVRISWTGGHGRHQVVCTLARGSRVALWARSVAVEINNLDQVNALDYALTVADGWGKTRNHRVENLAGNAAAQAVEVPVFATRARLELSDPAQLGSAQIDVYSEAGTLVSRTLGNAQPELGIALAGAAALQVLAPVAGRVVFDLAL